MTDEPRQSEERIVRVFVSSTFRDMQEEREELVKFTFPELRKRCRERQVEFVDVDLRWGVTDEEAAEGQVLPICLEEISRCRPYFIGLLGERYGWVPKTISQELIEREAWLKEHLEHSVTELEILHGVIRNPEMAEYSFFYFRDPEASLKVEGQLARNPNYEPEPQSSRAKLRSLKERIREHCADKIRENYPDARTAAQMVLDELWQVIDARFPLQEVPSALEREREQHEAFAGLRTKVYVGRQEYFDRLSEHAASDGPPLVIVGESGSGKSALIANWIERYREEHPEAFIVCHYIGGTADSADYVAMLRRIIEEVKERYEPGTEDGGAGLSQMEHTIGGAGAENTIPTDPEKVVEAFPLWLAKAAARGQFILVLDALNQLEDRDNAPDLGWLPWSFSSNVRLIVSTLAGRSLEALTQREWPALEVGPMERDERREYIEAYLGQYRKGLSPARTEKIIQEEQTANPLYLRTLLEELRVFGRHEELDTRIEHYLGAKTVGGLFDLVLERLEEDYERERQGLVGEVTTLLWASRRGMSETELLELFAAEGKSVLRAHWSPLYLALEESLVSHAGLLTFFHDFLKNAVEGRYLVSPELKKQAHGRIADYFAEREILDERKVDELPWQLWRGESWERLQECVTDIEVFLKLRTDAKQYELTGYWLSMGDRFNMVEGYREMIERYERTSPEPSELAYRLNETAFFLNLNGRYKGAEPLYRRALAISEKVLGPEHPETATSLNNLAAVLHAKGDYEGAESLYRRALAIYEKALGPEHPNTATGLNNLAVLLHVKGDYEGAEPLYRRALAIREKALGPDHPDTATSLNNFAELLHVKGDYEGAERLFRRSLAICEKVFGPDHPDTASSLNSLAGVVRTKGDYARADPLLRRALAIYEKGLGPEHSSTATSLNNLAGLLDAKGDYEGAEPLYRRALAIREKVLGPDHPDTATSLNNLAGLLDAKGDYEGAEPLYRQTLAILEKVLGLDHPDTASSLNNLAELLDAKGDYEGAEPLYRRALAIREKALGPEHPNTATSLNNLAELLDAKGDYEGAEPLYRQTLAILEKALGPDHPDTAASLNNLAVLLHRKGDYEGAEPHLRRALSILEKVLGPDHPDTAASLNNLAELLRVKGDYEGAEPLYRRALAIREKVLGPDHPSTATSLNNLALLVDAEGDCEGAEPLYRRALAISEKALGPDHPDTATSLNNLAVLLHVKGDYEGAEPLFRRALSIRQKALGPDHPDTAQSLDNLAELLRVKRQKYQEDLARWNALPWWERLRAKRPKV